MEWTVRTLHLPYKTAKCKSFLILPTIINMKVTVNLFERHLTALRLMKI